MGKQVLSKDGGSISKRMEQGGQEEMKQENVVKGAGELGLHPVTGSWEDKLTPSLDYARSPPPQTPPSTNRQPLREQELFHCKSM